MKMILIKEKEILDFEKEIEVELELKERAETLNLPRYYVSFPGCEVIEGRFLYGNIGNGETMDEALADYAKQLSNKTIVFNAYTNEREEIECPKLKHTKLLKKIKKYKIA